MNPTAGTAPLVQGHGTALADHEVRFYQQFRSEHPIWWLITFVIPFALPVLSLVAAFLIRGGDFAIKLLYTATATFFLLGRFVILGGDDPHSRDVARFLTRGELTCMLVAMDLSVACLLVFHAGFLFRIPFLGSRILTLAEDGQYFLKAHPWMRRVTFLGLVAFVLFPLAATGSVGGSIFGRLLGLSRIATFGGIVIGSVLGNGLMYMFAGLLGKYVSRDDPWLFWSGVAVIAGVVVLLNLRYQRIKRSSLGPQGGKQ